MVLHKFGDRLYAGLEEALAAHLAKVAELVDAAQGPAFLPELRTRWTEHNKSMQMIRDILMYMDRTYVKQQEKRPVHELGLALWKEHIVRAPRIAPRLLSTLLALVRRERDGEPIDRALLRAATSMLTDLGAGVYCDDFERAFLGATAEAYAAEAQASLAVCSLPEYLRKAESRLAEEAERCRAYLDVGTESKLTAVVEEELLGRHVKALLDTPHSGLIPLIEADRFEDLARLYALLRRPGVTGGLAALRTGMGTLLRETGRALVNDAERAKEPVDFVQRLLAEKDKYDTIIARSFGGDKQFANALNQVCLSCFFCL